MHSLINLPWSTVLKYPYHEEPAVRAAWQDGKHHKDCIGKCDITTTGGILRCQHCPLDEYSLLEKV